MQSVNLLMDICYFLCLFFILNKHWLQQLKKGKSSKILLEECAHGQHTVCPGPKVTKAYFKLAA